MKIGFDAKRYYHNNTGLGNYSRDLIRILSTHYPKKEYYLYNPKPAKQERPSYSNTFEIRPEGPIWSKLSSLWRQGPIIDQIRKNEVHIYHGLSGELPRGIEKLKSKSVVTIHDLIFMRYPQLYSKIDRFIHLKKFKYAAENADLIIAISDQTKADVIDFLGVSESKVEVVNQVCHPQFKQIPKSSFLSNLQLKYNLPKAFILNVGTIEARKNILSVIKAIHLHQIDIPLVIIGSKKDYYDQISSYISDNQPKNPIIFLSGLSMPELAGIYKLAKLFVYPSLFEGFGIPIIEALYSGIPVLTTKGGCFHEAGGPTTAYADTTNIDEIAHYLNMIIHDSELRTKMIENGLDYVKKFDDHKIAMDYMNVYNSLG